MKNVEPRDEGDVIGGGSLIIFNNELLNVKFKNTTTGRFRRVKSSSDEGIKKYSSIR